MTGPAWDRQAVVAELRDRIWLHLTPASTGTAVLLDAAALLRLPWDDVARLADLHLVLHPAVGTLLDSAPDLLRRLGSTTSRTTETGMAGVRGPVDWPATARRRVLDRTPTVVTHPSVRDNDVPPNRLLALLLAEVRDRAVSLKLRTGQTGTTGAVVAERGRHAAALAAHRALTGVTPAVPTPRDVQALASPRFARRHAPLLDAWAAYAALIQRGDPHAVRRAVEQQGLAAASDGALFEVLVLFRLRDVLNPKAGNSTPPGCSKAVCGSGATAAQIGSPAPSRAPRGRSQPRAGRRPWPEPTAHCPEILQRSDARRPDPRRTAGSAPRSTGSPG